MENKKLKAYMVTDNYWQETYVLVYASTPSKAKAGAYLCDGLEDSKYKELRAKRFSRLDELCPPDLADGTACEYYWFDPLVRRILVEHYGFMCYDFNIKECLYCESKDICDQYKDYMDYHNKEDLKLN